MAICIAVAQGRLHLDCVALSFVLTRSARSTHTRRAFRLLPLMQRGTPRPRTNHGVCRYRRSSIQQASARAHLTSRRYYLCLLPGFVNPSLTLIHAPTRQGGQFPDDEPLDPEDAMLPLYDGPSPSDGATGRRARR